MRTVAPVAAPRARMWSVIAQVARSKPDTLSYAHNMALLRAGLTLIAAAALGVAPATSQAATPRNDANAYLKNQAVSGSPRSLAWGNGIKLLVIIAQSNSEPADPSLTTSEISRRLFTASDSASHYLQLVSGGQASLSGRTGGNPEVVGPYTVSVPSDNNCRYRDWYDAGVAAATQAGIPAEQYDRIAVIRPLKNGCNNNSLITMNANAYPNVLVHELGHTFGSLHAGLVKPSCQITENTACDYFEYGDWLDPMGASPAYNYDTIRLSAIRQWEFGWMNQDQASLITGDGTYQIKPLDGAAGPRMLIIPRNQQGLPPLQNAGFDDGGTANPTGLSHISLEYRKDTGLAIDRPYYSNPNAYSGPLIRLSEDPDSGARLTSILIPGGVNLDGSNRMSWAPGSTFTDRGGLKISTLSADSQGATVKIEGLSPAPVAVDSLNLASSYPVSIGYRAPVSAFSIKAARYELMRDGAPAASQGEAQGTIIDRDAPAGVHSYTVDAIGGDGRRIGATAEALRVTVYASGPGPRPTQPPNTTPTSPLQPGTAKVKGKGRLRGAKVSFSLLCPETSSGCPGQKIKLSIGSGRKKLSAGGRIGYLEAGQLGRVEIKLSAKAARLLKKLGEAQLSGLGSAQKIKT